jgi:hypothetical protein
MTAVTPSGGQPAHEGRVVFELVSFSGGHQVAAQGQWLEDNLKLTYGTSFIT